MTSGLRGYFAILIDTVDRDVEQSGIGSYETAEQASMEARQWADAENLECDATVLGPRSLPRPERPGH